MAWAKIDDQFHSHRKVRRSGLEATGLFVMALSYCVRWQTDGRVDEDWLKEVVRNAPKRKKLLRILLENGLFERVDGHYLIHDYLDCNLSRDEWIDLKDKRRGAGQRGGRQAKRKASA